MHRLRLNPGLDTELLANRFAEAGHLQIEDFLDPSDARELAESLARLDWRLVLNSGPRHVDLPASQLVAIGEGRLAAIQEEVRRNAAHGFQYIYENWPVTDIAEAGQLQHLMLRAVYDTMNGGAVRDFLRTVTGEASDFCDMQATRYSSGHFLTIHTDEAPNRNRKLAYVLGLTDGWSSTWGGQLQFLDARSDVTRSYMPKFNALSVFRVPTPHHVSQVTSFAPKGRVSLTGWFRTR